MTIKKHIPNLLTLSNLFLGCLAIVCAFTDRLALVPILIFFAGFADFFDGFLARMLKVSSPIGEQLDSLADMVSFGVVPGIVIYQLLTIVLDPAVSDNILYLAPAFILTLFSALRLAKFNIDDRQSYEFIGLPTPACTLFFVPLISLLEKDFYGLNKIVLTPAFLYVTTLLFSYLLIAEIPMFAAKFKHFGWKGNEIRFIFIIVGALMPILFGVIGLSLVIVLYLTLVVINHFFLSPREEKVQQVQ